MAATFDELVEPMAVRVARPRCSDGHGTLTHLFFSENHVDTARAKAICSKCKQSPRIAWRVRSSAPNRGVFGVAS